MLEKKSHAYVEICFLNQSCKCIVGKIFFERTSFENWVDPDQLASILIKLADYPSRHVCLLSQTNMVMGHLTKREPQPHWSWHLYLLFTWIITVTTTPFSGDRTHTKPPSFDDRYISLRAWSIIKIAERPSFISFITRERNFECSPIGDSYKLQQKDSPI